jgi:hypothetical protein
MTSSGEFSEFSDAEDAPGGSGAAVVPAGASAELRELAHLSLSLLVAALEARLGRAAEGAALRCAVYARSPASLAAGKLQLQLVAATDGREAAAAAARQDLFLGVPGASASYQEAWIVEQPVIVLPDSGGLVLPLAHNDFLVGLLVVERGRPEGGGGGGASPLQPPAASLFGGADLGLVRQSGRALALACAMDLRAALERAGHAVRHRQVAGLMREARKPLSTLRTLGAMLRPRLGEGEPEADMANGILAQGERLGELVNQLQAALVPPPAAAERAAQGRWEAAGWSVAGQATLQPQAQQPWEQRAQAQQPAMQRRQYPPALPSSSIGADNWGSEERAAPSSSGDGGSGGSSALPPPSSSTDAAAAAAAEPAAASPAAAAPAAAPPAAAPPSAAPPAATDLAGVLVPLLASASNFASVSGISFLLAAEGGGVGGVAHFPAAAVAVDPLALKRLLAGLLDSVMARAARGDSIEAAVQRQAWEGQEGAAVVVRLLQGMEAVVRGVAGGGVEPAPDPGAHPEFVSLAGAAAQQGGWLRVEAHGPAEVEQLARGIHLPSRGAVLAMLWLPAASGGGGEPPP